MIFFFSVFEFLNSGYFGHSNINFHKINIFQV